MTTLYSLKLSTTRVFTFQPTLDNVLFNATVTWGLAGQRPYLNIFALNGAQVLAIPVIGSPDGITTSSIVWDALRGQVEITTAVPHGLKLGAVDQLTLSGVTPDAYNGIRLMFSTSQTTLTYPQMTDPGGPATVQGNIVSNVNLVEGYASTSTLVYRASTNTFEVTP